VADHWKRFIGLLVCLGSGACAGIVQVIFRKLKGKAHTFVIYSYLIPFIILFSSGITIFEGDVTSLNFNEWILALLIGIGGFTHNTLNTRSY